MNNTSSANHARASILDPFPPGKPFHTPRTGSSEDVRGCHARGRPRKAVAAAQHIEIPAHEAVSAHVVVGTAIQCLRGVVWLTQEGDTRDYAVPPGATFCTDRPGRAVLSALDDVAVVVLHSPDAHTLSCIPGAVTIDSMARLNHAARRARQAALVDIAQRFATWISERLKGLARANRFHLVKSTRVSGKPDMAGSWRTLDAWRN